MSSRAFATRKGENAKLPPTWLMYVAVADISESVARSQAMGETAIDGPQPAGGAKIAVIKDPVGAVLDLHNRELISDGDDLFDGNESLAEVSCDGE